MATSFSSITGRFPNGRDAESPVLTQVPALSQEASTHFYSGHSGYSYESHFTAETTEVLKELTCPRSPVSEGQH